MVLGAILGAGLGMLSGVTVGSIIFSSKATRDFRHLDQAADGSHTTGAGPKPSEAREILELSPHWTKWPDYERVAWINRMIATLWPHYNAAVADIISSSVKPVLEDTCRNVRVLHAIDIEHINLGDHPMKLGGIKTYETREDEVIIEAPVLWGSNAQIRVSVSLQLGPLRIFIPVVLKDVLLHAIARITIRPLVETLPCLGALHISLLAPPYLDLTLNLINGIDLMALPGIKEAVMNTVQNILGDMMLYPKQFSVDLMEGRGVPPPPAGMLKIDLVKMENLARTDMMSKTDSYCLLEIRAGRPQRSSTIKNSQNPAFDETFHLIVDDPEEQILKVTVKDDDFGWSDDTFGVCEFKLSELECFEHPHQRISTLGQIRKPEDLNLGLTGNTVKKLRSFVSKPIVEEKPLGTVYLNLTFYPFFRPGLDRAEESSEDEGQRSAEPSMDNLPFGSSQVELLQTRTSVREDLKGLLTITLTRCLHLAGKDTYVAFHLHDKVAKKTEVQKSTYVLNDDSPRWGDKFDFVMINANSVLNVMVMEKPGFMESMMSMKFVRKTEDKPIGVIKIPVPDLVRNGRLKDTWALQEVQQGEIELTLTWTTCEFAPN
eukprot:g9204.t1